MSSPVSDLLDLESVGADRYVGKAVTIGTPNLYGGHVLAQSLMAASRTVDADRHSHSLHGYFLLPGEHNDIEYQVERVRDGRSFSTRRVVALQRGKEIFEMTASFHLAESGVVHQIAAVATVGPDALESEGQQIQRMKDRLPARFQVPNVSPIGIEYRRVEPFDYLAPQACEGVNSIWLRASAVLPDDPALHRALLAYASDHGLLMAAMVHHGLSFVKGHVLPASLDHAMWFHQDFRMDDWILYQTESPAAQGARAFCRGHFFARNGRLIASTTQEGMLRLLEAGKAHLADLAGIKP